MSDAGRLLLAVVLATLSLSCDRSAENEAVSSRTPTALATERGPLEMDQFAYHAEASAVVEEQKKASKTENPIVQEEEEAKVGVLKKTFAGKVRGKQASGWVGKVAGIKLLRAGKSKSGEWKFSTLFDGPDDNVETKKIVVLSVGFDPGVTADLANFNFATGQHTVGNDNFREIKAGDWCEFDFSLAVGDSRFSKLLSLEGEVHAARKVKVHSFSQEQAEVWKPEALLEASRSMTGSMRTKIVFHGMDAEGAQYFMVKKTGWQQAPVKVTGEAFGFSMEDFPKATYASQKSIMALWSGIQPEGKGVLLTESELQAARERVLGRPLPDVPELKLSTSSSGDPVASAGVQSFLRVRVLGTMTFEEFRAMEVAERDAGIKADAALGFGGIPRVRHVPLPLQTDEKYDVSHMKKFTFTDDEKGPQIQWLKNSADSGKVLTFLKSMNWEPWQLFGRMQHGKSDGEFIEERAVVMRWKGALYSNRLLVPGIAIFRVEVQGVSQNFPIFKEGQKFLMAITGDHGEIRTYFGNSKRPVHDMTVTGSLALRAFEVYKGGRFEPEGRLELNGLQVSGF